MPFGVDQPALDLVISERFLDELCSCEACGVTFERVKKLVEAIENREQELVDLENNLEGELNPELPQKPDSNTLNTNSSTV